MRQSTDIKSIENSQPSDKINSLNLKIKFKEFDNIDINKIDHDKCGLNDNRYPGYFMVSEKGFEKNGRNFIEKELNETYIDYVICTKYKKATHNPKTCGMRTIHINEEPSGGKNINYILYRFQYVCEHCGARFSVDPSFVITHRRMTYRCYFSIKNDIEILETNYSAIGKKFNQSRETIRNLDMAWLAQENTIPDLPPGTCIGCDEHSIHKGQSYVSIICSIPEVGSSEKPHVLFMCEGRKSEDVKPFFDFVKACGNQDNIKAMSTDFTCSYISSTKDMDFKFIHEPDEFH